MDDKTNIRFFALLLALASISLVIAVSFYIHHFGPDISSDQEVWGQFGDYLGGTLNPIFGFLTLIAIISTLAIQTRQLEVSIKQLSLSRAELEATRQELKRSAEAQEETATSIRRQAHFSALSAKIAATSSAIQAIDQQMSFRRTVNLDNLAVLNSGPNLLDRRKALEETLYHLLDEADGA